MTLSENIKSRRKHLRLSQEYVADQLGISRQAVAKWENGKSKPTAANLAELAALFEMSISELTDSQTYTEEQPMEKQQAQQEKRKMEKIEIFLGAAMIFSIFFLPWLLPVQKHEMKNFFADMVTYILIIILAAKYWRYIWKIK